MSVLALSVRPAARERDRCPHCGRRCSSYDLGEGRCRWRTLECRHDCRVGERRSSFSTETSSTTAPRNLRVAFHTVRLRTPPPPLPQGSIAARSRSRRSTAACAVLLRGVGRSQRADLIANQRGRRRLSRSAIPAPGSPNVPRTTPAARRWLMRRRRQRYPARPRSRHPRKVRSLNCLLCRRNRFSHAGKHRSGGCRTARITPACSIPRPCLTAERDRAVPLDRAVQTADAERPSDARRARRGPPRR